uniref:PiggyBac transposable element-derived protein domain-containing protein n=1 Tax=Graphocephala atropunctata TaxID=36148 RepID=A0A1B6LLL4_9HEMI
MTQVNDDDIQCWLEENDHSEGNTSMQGNLTDTDGTTDCENLGTQTEQSDDEGDDESLQDTPQTVNEEIDLEPIQEAGSAQPLRTHERKRPNSQVTAFYTSKDGLTKWNIHVPEKTKTRKQNIVQKLPSVVREFRDYKTQIECWKIFFPDHMLSEIVRFTNQQLGVMRQNYARDRDCLDTDIIEIKAFFGLMYLIGVKKGNHLNTEELWATDGTAPDIYVATMSKRRFHNLVQAIRFDDKNTRAQRKLTDKAAPMREIFEQFVSLCKISYNVGELATIDEMLEGFRGRCKFRQYIPNKPAKYGIKIYALVDAKTFFTSNMEIYTGKQPQGPYFTIENNASSVVKRMIKPIDKSGRNVTIDNYFTSVPLLNDLYTNHRLTVVGTIRKNKKELPQELLCLKSRPKGSSMFAFPRPPNKCTIVSYIPDKKTKKNVLLASTMHLDDEIDPDSGDAQKPTIITFYNMTKGGVDVVDRLKSEYSVTRVSNRWPFTVFGGLLNVGAVNAQIIYKTNTGELKQRRVFLTELAKELIKPHMTRRASIQTLPTNLREKIRYLTSGQRQITPARPQEERARCSYCPVRKNRFTTKTCSSCGRKLCGDHIKTTIYKCHPCDQDPASSSDE